MIDPQSKETYYWNLQTNATQWHHPQKEDGEVLDFGTTMRALFGFEPENVANEMSSEEVHKSELIKHKRLKQDIKAPNSTQVTRHAPTPPAVFTPELF